LHGALRLRLLLPVGSPVQPKPVLPDAAVIREKDEELLLQVCLCHDREAGMDICGRCESLLVSPKKTPPSLFPATQQKL
jgi:hypothetical protein